MSRVTELEKALTTLFRKGTEVGYTETEIDEFLENIDYHALLQAVWNKAETVYAYRADGKNSLSLDYRSAELFKQRATLLYEDVGDSYIWKIFRELFDELCLPFCRRAVVRQNFYPFARRDVAQIPARRFCTAALEIRTFDDQSGHSSNDSCVRSFCSSRS